MPDITAIALLNPFDFQRTERTWPEGTTLAQMIDDLDLSEHIHLIVTVDGDVVPRGLWDKFTPRPGHEIAFRAVPTGGDGKSPLRTILMLVVTVAAAYAAGPIGAAAAAQFGGTAAAWTAVTYAAISVGGALAINALVPPPTPNMGVSGEQSYTDSPTYALTGARNSLQPYAVVPQLLGEHRITPRFAAMPYTELIGDDQYMYLYFAISKGPVALSGHRIGDTDIDEFRDLQMEIFDGINGDIDTPSTLYPRAVKQLDLNIVIEQASSWHTRTTPPATTQISVDLTCQRGLIELLNTGERNERIVQVEVQYSATGADVWQDVEGLTYFAERSFLLHADTGKRNLIYMHKETAVLHLVKYPIDTADAQIVVPDYAWGLALLDYDPNDSWMTPPTTTDLRPVELRSIAFTGGGTFNFNEAEIVHRIQFETVYSLSLFVAGDPIIFGWTGEATATLIEVEAGAYQEANHMWHGYMLISQTSGASLGNENFTVDGYYCYIHGAPVLQRYEIVGQISGATAFIDDAVVTSGSWAGADAAGTFALRGGNNVDFSDGEDLHLADHGLVASCGTYHSQGKLIAAATYFENTTVEACELIMGPFNLVGRTTDALRRSRTWIVPEGQYDVRVRRVTADSTSDQIADVATWTAMRSYRDTQPVLEANLTRVVMVIKGTDQLSGIVDTYNVIGQQYALDYIEPMALAPWGHVFFTNGAHEPEVGQTIEGETSGATAIVYRVHNAYPPTFWNDGTAGGWLVITDLAGTFLDGESITIVETAQAGALTLDSTVTWHADPTTAEAESDQETFGGPTEGTVPTGTYSWTTGPVRNPAAIYRHVLQSQSNPRAKPDAEIDLDVIADWYLWCVENSWAFDHYVDYASSVETILRMVAAAGRASPGVSPLGLDAVIMDREQANWSQTFTPRNTWGFGYEKPMISMPHAFRVRFWDRTNNWEESEHLVYAPGHDATTANKFEELPLPGITTTELCDDHAAYHYAVAQFRPDTIRFNCDAEHLHCTRGDRIKYANPIITEALAIGRIKEYILDEGVVTHIIMDTDCPMPESDIYGLFVRVA